MTNQPQPETALETVWLVEEDGYKNFRLIVTERSASFVEGVVHAVNGWDVETNEAWELQQYLTFLIKSDQCSNITFGDEDRDGYLHLCGGITWKYHSKLMAELFAWAKAAIPMIDDDVGCVSKEVTPQAVQTNTPNLVRLVEDDGHRHFRVTITESEKYQIKGDVHAVTAWDENNEPSEFEEYLSFYMKSDECCHVTFGRKGMPGFVHLCDQVNWERHCQMMTDLFAWAKARIPMT